MMGTISTAEVRQIFEYLGKAEAAARSVLPAMHAQNIFVAGVPAAIGTITGSIVVVRGFIEKAAVVSVAVEAVTPDQPA